MTHKQLTQDWQKGVNTLWQCANNKLEMWQNHTTWFGNCILNGWLDKVYKSIQNQAQKMNIVQITHRSKIQTDLSTLSPEHPRSLASPSYHYSHCTSNKLLTEQRKSSPSPCSLPFLQTGPWNMLQITTHSYNGFKYSFSLTIIQKWNSWQQNLLVNMYTYACWNITTCCLTCCMYMSCFYWWVWRVCAHQLRLL